MHFTMRCYIAGPMRGIPDFNFPTFDAAAVELRKLGFDVVNPADMDRAKGQDEKNPPSFPECMERDLAAICGCSHIYLLPGWEESVGVRPEAILGDALGLTFLVGENFREVPAIAVVAVIAHRIIGRYAAENN